jgi:alanine racemase
MEKEKGNRVYVESVYHGFSLDVLVKLKNLNSTFLKYHLHFSLIFSKNGVNPAKKKKKKTDLLSFSLIFYFSHFILFLSFSNISFFFYFNIEDNVVF